MSIKRGSALSPRWGVVTGQLTAASYNLPR
jgi:hypothetical protein